MYASMFSAHKDTEGPVQMVHICLAKMAAEANVICFYDFQPNGFSYISNHTQHPHLLEYIYFFNT